MGVWRRWVVGVVRIVSFGKASFAFYGGIAFLGMGLAWIGAWKHYYTKL